MSYHVLVYQILDLLEMLNIFKKILRCQEVQIMTNSHFTLFQIQNFIKPQSKCQKQRLLTLLELGRKEF